LPVIPSFRDSVIPAQAGIQFFERWIPARAGMTEMGHGQNGVRSGRESKTPDGLCRAAKRPRVLLAELRGFVD
jgi:hypothetical protein